MNKKVTEERAEPTRFQIILGEDIEKALRKYIGETYGQDTRVYTAIIRRAVIEFLRREGCYNDTTAK